MGTLSMPADWIVWEMIQQGEWSLYKNLFQPLMKQLGTLFGLVYIADQPPDISLLRDIFTALLN